MAGLDKRTALYWAIGGAVGTAVLIGAYRLIRKEPIRHAVNGLFGIAIGAFLAYRTGDAKDFYLPGILHHARPRSALLVLSVLVRRPIIGYVWGVLANRGKHDWFDNTRLFRTFQWLTLVWAGSLFVRAGVQGWLYLQDQATAIGIVRILISWPIYAATFAFTVWAVRRVDPARQPKRPSAQRPLGAVGAQDDRADLVLDLGGADEDQLVAGLQRVVRGRHQHPLAAQDRDQRGVARQRHVADRLARRTARLGGSVISTRFASPCRNVISRTRSPTVTASSTSAAIRRGLLTATSTPHCSVNSHSFSARFTRATTRGTANSVLASSDTTRLTLSSPVAATTTSQPARSASSRLLSSQASASTHSASGTRSGRSWRGCRSISITWWPLPISSCAIDRPTLPAPAMAIRMVSALPGRRPTATSQHGRRRCRR